LFSGLSESISKQPESARGLISAARWVVILSWFFYPIVYFAPFVISLEGGATIAVIEIGYTIADIVAKAVFGVMIFMIAVRKSESEAA
jgi:bacteriorhodopsin